MHKVRRLAAAAGVVAVAAAGLTIAPPQAGAAGDCAPAGSIWGTENASNAKLVCDGSSKDPDQTTPAGKRSSGRATKPACVWVPEPTYRAGAGQKVEGVGGHWYRKFCSFGDYQTLADFEAEMSTWDAMNMRRSNMLRRAGMAIQWFTTPPPAPRRTPQQVMASVADSLLFPKTFIAVNPVATKQLVGVPTWVWLTDNKGQYQANRYNQRSKTIVLEGYPLQWQIVPQLAVTPGDGSEEPTCTGAGVPWSATAEGDPGACTVTYDRSGQYTLSASVGWTVQWWLDGTRQEDIAGPTNTATRPVTVLEVEALTR